jgi:hypothetical protein
MLQWPPGIAEALLSIPFDSPPQSVFVGDFNRNFSLLARLLEVGRFAVLRSFAARLGFEIGPFSLWDPIRRQFLVGSWPGEFNFVGDVPNQRSTSKVGISNRGSPQLCRGIFT